ncbi:MAG: glycosyltransferase [Flavobacterium sp.]|uniref:glycosyltransferase n=1 Tax=Flavobacterium sp. TaxID=239 RepID=UPI0022BC5842|nr:glycosyltransferase [Flavobacterium sp.]MCZ8330804.1 glycosyltransferase [Flavobacterium sp.]
MSKKILLVSNGFYPENSPRSFRATELAKELVRQGNQVTVITHPRQGVETFCQQNGIAFKSLGNLTWAEPTAKGTGIIRLFWRVIVRMSLLLFEYPKIQLVFLVKKALKNETGYDALISIAVPYPIHWGVASIWSKKIAKVWIADCGDPYMGQENDTFKPAFYFKWVEKWFCKKTDYLTVPTEKSVAGYYPEFHSKIKVIPQGFRFEDVQLFTGEKDNSKVVFGYAGMFIPGRRDPSEFLEFINTVESDKPFEFHIYTTTPQFVQPYIKNNGRVILKELVPRDKLLFELSKMDFMVNFENVGNTQTPSKLIDYLIIEKPVLSIKYGDLNKQAVHQFLKADYTQKMLLPDRELYRIENVASKFTALIP